MSVSIYGFVFFLGRRLSLRKSMLPPRRIEVGQHTVIKLFLRCHNFSYKSFFVWAMTKAKRKGTKRMHDKPLSIYDLRNIDCIVLCVSDSTCNTTHNLHHQTIEAYALSKALELSKPLRTLSNLSKPLQTILGAHKKTP